MDAAPTLQPVRRRTRTDVLLGTLSVAAGVIVLGHVAAASLISILFIGWTLVLGGLTLAIAAIAGWADPGVRWDLPAGALLVILGFSFVGNPGVGLLVLTLLAGSLLLVGGIVRVFAAFQPGVPRGILLANGLITSLLGAVILTRWPVSALWLLGGVLGVQLIVDGVTTAVAGRLRTTPPADPTPAVA